MDIRLSIVAALLLATAAAITRAQAPAPIAGVVFDDANRNGQRDTGERGLIGVAVSNQREVVQTAADGSYSLPRGPYGLVFTSLPDGYAAAADFWRVVSPSSNRSVDFALTARPASGTFTFIHASDPHVSAQTLGRLQQLRGIAEKYRPDFVLVTGDLVRDALRVGEEEARGYYDLYTQEVRRFPMSVWNVPGNHDNFGIVSNFGDVLASIGARDWPLALGGHLHTRESISFGSTVRTRFHQAAAVVGPTESAIPAISGVTLYRVKNRVVDDGEFIPLR